MSYIDNLIEKAFSDGYEYAQIEFSKKKKKEDKDNYNDLTLGDKAAVFLNKHLTTKGMRDASIRGYDKGDWKGVSNYTAGILGTMGGVAGLHHGAKGALAGAAIGATGGYLGTRVGGKLHDLAKKHIHTSMRDEDRLISDRLKLANGDISKAEFLRRHNR